jgi:predicted DsbA family dithiol-disulfide isomerase
MEAQTPISQDTVLSLAKQAGLDINKLKADMESPDIAAEIKTNVALASAIGMEGTPAFVIGGSATNKPGWRPHYVPGEVSEDVLQNYITQAAK